MTRSSTRDTYIVIPNWNGKDRLKACLDSIQNQSHPSQTVVVDNGSTDGSSDYLRKHYPWVHIVQHDKNLGFTGGVNGGITYALAQGAEFIALLNNDAIIEKNWVKFLRQRLEKNQDLGAVTCKLLSADKKRIDSTGDYYTSWGLSVPRQRDHKAEDAINHFEYVLGACAGASLYRTKMFDDVDLFDQKFFAYFEDTDFNLRMQSAGWKAGYEPKAEAYHATGSTGNSIKGFTTYQTMKNLPMLFWKNVPWSLVPHMLPRFTITYCSILASSITHGKGWYALKGLIMSIINTPYMFWARHKILSNRKVSDEYLASHIIFDLPEQAYKLRKLRSSWWKIRGRAA